MAIAPPLTEGGLGGVNSGDNNNTTSRYEANEQEETVTSVPRLLGRYRVLSVKLNVSV